jgi:hypothetical protein
MSGQRMRKALLAFLLVPLCVARLHDPARNGVEPTPPAGFPLTFERSSSDPVRPSVLLFPLDGQGTELAVTSPEDGVLFDLDGDGIPERVAWSQPGATVAFLALDVNADGRINSGRELFGVGTLQDTFRRSGAPLSGSIHDGHDLYDRLLLWVDRDHNGRSDPAELTKARDRFTAIGLGFVPARWADAHANRIRVRGWMHVRTAGPDQGEPTGALEDLQRTRHYFDVELQTTRNR